jgi:hypothetical protein
VAKALYITSLGHKILHVHLHMHVDLIPLRVQNNKVAVGENSTKDLQNHRKYKDIYQQSVSERKHICDTVQ